MCTESLMQCKLFAAAGYVEPSVNIDDGQIALKWQENSALVRWKVLRNGHAALLSVLYVDSVAVETQLRIERDVWFCGKNLELGLLRIIEYSKYSNIEIFDHSNLRNSNSWF